MTGLLPLALGLVASYLLPIRAGWNITAWLCPSIPKALRAALGMGLGVGISGAAWMLCVLVTNSSGGAFLVSELSLLILILFTEVKKSPAPLSTSKSAAHRSFIESATLKFVTVCVILSFLVSVSITRHGEYDATAIWNTKARFLYRANQPMELLVNGTLPDYPLLLPSIVARGWQYCGTPTPAVPISLAILLTSGIVVIVIWALRLSGAGHASLIAASVLLGTPYFMRQAISQQADLPIGFFITAATVLIAMPYGREDERKGRLFLAGIAIGFAACIKNEGTLFVVAVLLGLTIPAVVSGTRRAGVRRLLIVAAGAAPGLLVLAVFKRVAVPSVLAGNITFANLQARIGDANRHQIILHGFLRDLAGFGNWWINPWIFILLLIVLHRLKSRGMLSTAWRFPALVIGFMLCGYYGVYLFTPYPLEWHVASSLPRLLVQLWPSMVIAGGLLTAVRSAGNHLPGENVLQTGSVSNRE
jgi:hypothetical protein